MADEAQPSVLKRKAEAGRAPSGGGALTPARALGQSFAKAADELLGLPVKVAEARDTRISLAELPERLEELSLLAVLDGPEEGLGLLALSPDLLATLIEMQTTGHLSAGEVARRRPTRTDAALSIRFVNAVLGLFENQLAAEPAVIWAGGFRYGSTVDDARPLGLMFEDCVYRALPVLLDCGTDPVRRCSALLVLPADGKGPPPTRLNHAEDAPDQPSPDAERDWQERIDLAVMGARAPIEAVLDRVIVPFSSVLSWKPGDLVPLSKNALLKLRIEGRGRRLLTHGKLGQAQGNLAVRLHMAGQDGVLPEDEVAAASQALSERMLIAGSDGAVEDAHVGWAPAGSGKSGGGADPSETRTVDPASTTPPGTRDQSGAAGLPASPGVTRTSGTKVG